MLITNFGDGDTDNQILPFQILEDIVDYNITSLTVTAVPEPALVCMLLPILSMLARCRRYGKPSC